MKIKILSLFVIFLFMLSADAHAGGAAMRRQGAAMPQQQGVEQKIQMQEELHQKLLEKQEQQGAPDEVMDFDALWEELAVSSEVWMRLVDRQIKALIVQTYIDWYREQGIVIQKSQVDYMLLLDSIALNNPELFDQPFQNVLMFAAVMEYDFDNGANKDELAYKVLGPQLYEVNRKRRGNNTGQRPH